MNCSIPILIMRERNYYSVRPLLFSEPETTGSLPERAIDELETELKNKLNDLIESENFREAQLLLQSPLARLIRIPIEIDRQKMFLRTKIHFAYWKRDGIVFLFAPFLKDFLFIVPERTDLKAFAQTAVLKWIRRQKKEYDDKIVIDALIDQENKHNPTLAKAYFNLTGEPTISENSETSEERLKRFVRQGAAELHDVGSQHRFFPNMSPETTQPETIRRFEERLFSLLTGSERKSAILLGNSCSGRTRLIKSTLLRIDRERNFVECDGFWKRDVNGGPVPGWTLTPGNMIAGMSETGGWERRCRSIFEFASYADLILRFEPFLGFLETGKSASGRMSIADVLRTELARERFRAVVELTPEELRLLRERDRRLVRQFEILETPTLTPDEEREIVVRSFQTLSIQQKSSCSPLFLPALMQATEYFESDKAAPGRACRWLPKIFREWETRRDDFEENESLLEYQSNLALSLYQRVTGNDVSFFRIPDSQSRDVLKKTDATKDSQASRRRIVDELSAGIIGQKNAIDILADTALKVKTHLNDLSRTAGAFLFVGPSGVGKTEAAKQLAKVLFGGEEGMIRFDANELTTPNSVAALLGDGNREGSLVSAVRLRPRCVLLFDEIEKAHRDLTDLLLQVLGEGRLTDGNGRIVSFAQCVVIFTSNLGARNAGRFSGFDTAERDEEWFYEKAIRESFRPEWLNRLDAIVPFKRLTRRQLIEIAKKMLAQVKNREGFRKRKIFLSINPNVVEYLTEKIDDVRLGARGVIRLLEKEFVVPIAEFLAGTTSQNISILEAERRGDQIAFYFSELERPASRSLLDRLNDAFDNQSLRAELFPAVLQSLKDCQKRYGEIFPTSGEKETEEERRRRFAFFEYVNGNIQKLLNEDENDSPRMRKLAQKPTETKIKDRHDRGGRVFRRINLSLKEWDAYLTTVYRQTAAQIAAKLENAQRRVRPGELEEHFDLWAVFNSRRSKREGAVCIQKILHPNDENDENDVWQIPSLPDWFPTPEIKQGTTKKGKRWRSAVGTTARYWIAAAGETELFYDGDSPTDAVLRKIILFDPATETPEEVVERWENDERRTWGPVTRIAWRSLNYSNERRLFPEEWIPETILEILKRYLEKEELVDENL